MAFDMNQKPAPRKCPLPVSAPDHARVVGFWEVRRITPDNTLPSWRMNRRAAAARREVYNGRRGYNVPRQFDVVIERDQEGYYIASVPQIPACHTQPRSLDEVTHAIREA